MNELSAGLQRSLVATLQGRANALSQNLPDIGGGPGPNQQNPAPPPLPYTRVDQGATLSQVLGADGQVQASSGTGTTRPILSAAQLATARHHEILITRDIPGLDQPALLLATGVGGSAGTVIVEGTSLETVNNAVGQVETALFVAGPLAVVLGGLAVWLIAGAALRPVERMRRQAASISATDEIALLAKPHTRDELAALANTLNALLLRLQGALSRQRGFVAAAGHELRTPLAILKGELELAGKPGRSREELVAAIGEAAGETERLIRLAEDLLFLARVDDFSPALRQAPHDITAVLAASIASFSARSSERGVTVRAGWIGPVLAQIDEIRVRQLADNLIDNALRFAPRGSVVDVKLRSVEGELALEVSDSGPGFPVEFLPHAFERFSRAPQTQGGDDHGIGLGLAIVRAIARAHGGHVKAANSDCGGALVTVNLPLDQR